MATDKNNSNTPEEKSTLTKIAETIGTVAGEIAVKKDQLVDMASGAIDSVKETIQNITGAKKEAPKKAKAPAKKAAAKKPAAVKAAAKKSFTEKSCNIKKSGDQKSSSC